MTLLILWFVAPVMLLYGGLLMSSFGGPVPAKDLAIGRPLVLIGYVIFFVGPITASELTRRPARRKVASVQLIVALVLAVLSFIA